MSTYKDVVAEQLCRCFAKTPGIGEKSGAIPGDGRTGRRAADDNRRKKRPDFINQRGVEQGAKERCAGLGPDGHDPAGGENAEQLVQVEAGVPGFAKDDLGAGAGDRQAPGGIAGIRGGNNGVAGRREERGCWGNAASRIGDDAYRLVSAEDAAGARREGRIIGEDGAAAGENRVDAGAFLV